jgi:hypothetical protein
VHVKRWSRSSPGPSSVHTWIKVFAKYLDNRNPLIKHVIEKHGEETKTRKLKTRIPQPRDFIYLQVLTSRTC